MAVNYKLIGRRIQEIRKYNEISQAELAEYTDLSAPYISHIETGLKKASLESLIRIANVLGVTVDQLLNGNQWSDRKQYITEITKLLQDCNAADRRIIFEMAVALKKSLHENKWTVSKDEDSHSNF
jgi:transcriptional regulator with XRE-family HTH domain